MVVTLDEVVVDEVVFEVDFEARSFWIPMIAINMIIPAPKIGMRKRNGDFCTYDSGGRPPVGGGGRGVSCFGGSTGF